MGLGIMTIAFNAAINMFPGTVQPVLGSSKLGQLKMCNGIPILAISCPIQAFFSILQVSQAKLGYPLVIPCLEKCLIPFDRFIIMLQGLSI